MYNRKFKVRFFAILFLCVAAAIAVALLVPALSVKSAFFDNKEVQKERNTFSDVKFKSQDKNGREIDVLADSVQDQGSDNFKLNKVESKFTLSENDTATIVADATHVFRENKNQCELLGNVKLTTDSGLTLVTEQSFVDFDKSFITGNCDVTITYSTTKLFGDSYSFDANTRTLILIGNANGVMNSDTVTANKLTVVFTVNDNKTSVKEMTAVGNVHLLYTANLKKYKISSQHLTALFDADGSIRDVKADSFLTVKTETAIIRANSGTFKDGIVNAYGDVAVISDNGDVFGDKATLNTETGEVSISKSSGIVGDGRR